MFLDQLFLHVGMDNFKLMPPTFNKILCWSAWAMVQWLLVCSGCPQKRIDCTCSRPARGGRRGSTPPKIKSVPTLEKLPYSKKALSLGMTKIWTPWEDLGILLLLSVGLHLFGAWNFWPFFPCWNPVRIRDRFHTKLVDPPSPVRFGIHDQKYMDNSWDYSCSIWVASVNQTWLLKKKIPINGSLVDWDRGFHCHVCLLEGI